MNIALIGYGKMGHIIEEVARERGHQVVCIIDRENTQDFDSEAFATADVAIEFTTPATAEENIRRAWSKGKPVVCGTTGWCVDAMHNGGESPLTTSSMHAEPAQATDATHGESRGVSSLTTDTVDDKEHPALIWSSNFSIGVNILFALNKQLAKIMQHYPQYTPSITEVHHVHKLDAPSGTAKTLAEQISINNEQLTINMHSGVQQTTNPIDAAPSTNLQTYEFSNSYPVPITSIREGEVAGIHTVQWDSEEDTLSIRHEAKSRKGFALGAVLAAEWIIGKTGVHTMEEVLWN